VQSRENMTPLFRKFEKSEIDDSVLEHVVEIINKAQQRRYVDANDAYLRLSIGKAYVPPSSSSFPLANVLQSMAHWCHHGRYPRAFRAREAAPG
jgi:hypothetical protein